jgi:hypothetical protein
MGLLRSHLAVADDVVMADGERLTGRIFETDEDPMLLQTTYAGMLALSSEKGNTGKNGVDIDYELGHRRGWPRFRSLGVLEFDMSLCSAGP